MNVILICSICFGILVLTMLGISFLVTRKIERKYSNHSREYFVPSESSITLTSIIDYHLKDKKHVKYKL